MRQALVGSPNLITARLDLVHNALYAVCLCGYAHVAEYIPNVIGQAHHSIYKKLCMHSKITFNKRRFTVCTENTDYRPTDYRQFRLSATPIIGNFQTPTRRVHLSSSFIILGGTGYSSMYTYLIIGASNYWRIFGHYLYITCMYTS